MDFQVESPMDKPKDVVVILYLDRQSSKSPIGTLQRKHMYHHHGLVVDVVGVSGLICNTIYAAGKILMPLPILNHVSPHFYAVHVCVSA